MKWRWIGLGLLVASLVLVVWNKESEEEVKEEIVLAVEHTPVPELYDLPAPPATQVGRQAQLLSTPVPTPSPTPPPEPTPRPDPTPTPDVWSPDWLEPWFAQYAGMYGVDKNMLERLANCESHYDPSAMSGPYVGLFQFGPVTWQVYRGRMGLDASLDLRHNAEESIRTGAYVLSVAGSGKWPSCL